MNKQILSISEENKSFESISLVQKARKQKYNFTKLTK